MWRGTSAQKAAIHLQWKDDNILVHWKDNFITHPISSTIQESHFHGGFFFQHGGTRGGQLTTAVACPSFEKWKIWKKKKGKKRSVSIQKACDI